MVRLVAAIGTGVNVRGNKGDRRPIIITLGRVFKLLLQI